MHTNIEDFIINKKCSIDQAVSKINTVFPKSVYVIDDTERLIGSISDGDVRRGIIKKVDFSNTVEQIMYKSPHKIYIGDTSKSDLIEKFKEIDLPSVPIVDFDNKIVDIIILRKIPLELTANASAAKENFVFILAGGEGNRLKPLTNIIPKPLIPIGKYPILEMIMDKFKACGFNKFIVSLNYKADLIKLYFDNPQVRNKYSILEYIEEKIPLGTIGSLFYARNYIHEDFLISNADIFIKENIEKIFNFHKENNAILTIVGCVKKSILSYGVLDINDNGELISMQEKPSLKHIVNTGVYVAKPEIIYCIKENTHTDITQVIEFLLKDRKKVCVYQIDDSQWFDIGQWDELKKTVNLL